MKALRFFEMSVKVSFISADNFPEIQYKGLFRLYTTAIY